MPTLALLRPPAHAVLPAQCEEKLQALATALMAQCPSGTRGTAAAEDVLCHLWPTCKPAEAAAAAGPAPPHAVTQLESQQAANGASAAAPAPAPAQLPLHLSLSRTVPLRRIQFASLLAALGKQLRPFKACHVQLQGLMCLLNDNATRCFVGIRVANGDAQVCCLAAGLSCHACDASAECSACA